MGHQFTRPALAAAVALALVVAACGGDDESGDLPAVLDNARALVTTPSTEPADVEPSEEAADGDAPAAAVVEELPPPDASTFEGANRVVNLWVGADGETTEIDVWGRRTFTNGPVLLAASVAFGEASEYFAAPPTHSLVIVGAGAGPDGVELAGIFNAARGEQSTTIFTNDDNDGTAWAPTIWEHGTEQAPDGPTPGTGLVILRTANTAAFTDELTASVGGDSFYVGDGSSECRTQRIEADGFQQSVLGGTQSVELELPPGTADISLHPWFSPDECDQPAALSLGVDVVSDETTMVVVFSRDGVSIETLVLPVAPPGE